MATRLGTRVDGDGGHTVITWATLAQATSDVGNFMYVGDLVDLVAQVTVGTNTNTLVMQGSVDGTAVGAIGAGVTLTCAGTTSQLQPVSNPQYIRPSTPSANTAIVKVSGYRRGS